MKFLEIDQIARNTLQMPNGLSLPEQSCFCALRNLYHSYKRKMIDTAQAGKEKRAIHAEFDWASTEYSRRSAAYAQYQEDIRNAGQSWETLAKDAAGMTDAQLVDRLMEIISHMVGETVTADAVRRTRNAAGKAGDQDYQ